MSEEVLVTARALTIGKPLPLLIEPAVDGLDLLSWGARHRDRIERHLNEHGAILFRGFANCAFEELVRSIAGEPMEYLERSSPRHSVGGRVYTSTDHPADQGIFLHCENAYAHTWPLRIFFHCITPARRGGETPLADCRRVLSRIDASLVKRFDDKGVMYVRNLGRELGVPWQAAFQTEDRAEVESQCRAAGYEFEWKGADRLRTVRVGQVIAEHPRTGERVWFNHAAFFHVSTLERTTREALLAQFDEADLPANTYYGDGSEIEPQALDQIREAYRGETTTFPWQRGDVLMVDNMLTAHGRAPFEGPREVWVAMCEPFSL